MFQAFGVVGALLLLIATICAAMAASKLKPPKPNFPSLTSRLRVAIKADPIQSGQIEAATDAATAVLRAPSAPVTPGLKAKPPTGRDNRDIRAGLILLGTLLGWAAVRRRNQARRMEA